MTKLRKSSPGLIIETQGMNTKELSQVSTSPSVKNLAKVAKQLTGRMFLSRDEKKALKEIHLQITKRIGHGYEAQIQLAIDRKLHHMRHALTMEMYASLPELLQALEQSLKTVHDTFLRLNKYKNESLNHHIGLAKKWEHIPWAVEELEDYGRRSTRKLKEHTFIMEDAIFQQQQQVQNNLVQGSNPYIAHNAPIQNFIEEALGDWETIN